ncbi:MAG: Z1 domain-containing protein [Candidatus Symbiobacter sp.]|nr:Z1 domain-containing protein [Candidatus Symbiobacter sp.]
MNQSNSGNEYSKQLSRVISHTGKTGCIELVVDKVTDALRSGTNSLVIYGEPQSGKTEMMICLTAKLIDEGYKTIIILVNDSIDLLKQNLDRFQSSMLNPAPKNLSDLKAESFRPSSRGLILIAKKNSKDLNFIIDKLSDNNKNVVIDDEADFATPNSKINKGEFSKINDLIERLINFDKMGIYIGVTATPARLDLNNTYNNDRSRWVYFKPHENYYGQEKFFPHDSIPKYMINQIPDDGDKPKYLVDAIYGFLVNVGFLNTREIGKEQNYCMLVHTSGRKNEHLEDTRIVREFFNQLDDINNPKAQIHYDKIASLIEKRHGYDYVNNIIDYIKENNSRNVIKMINSDKDKTIENISDSATPKTPFTIAIGGNIVSRGVTFVNLLSMYFTRTAHTIQQDTYIQRARMFGNRGEYFNFFELHIPKELFKQWNKCFLFHRMALDLIKAGKQPVWFVDKTVNAVFHSSVDKINVSIKAGTIYFPIFAFTDQIENLTKSSILGRKHLEKILSCIQTDNIPAELIARIKYLITKDETVAFYFSTPIDNYSDANIEEISRKRGLIDIGKTERNMFPYAQHHFKIFYNKNKMARLYYRMDDDAIKEMSWRKK